MTEIVLMSDPKVAAVPVQECGELPVDVRRDIPLLVDERKWQDSAGA
jgi:D-alanyl-D-alanine dipeptidase